MPRVISYDWSEDCQDRLQMIIEHRMKKLKVSQAELGDLLDMTQQNFGKKLKSMSFTWIQLVKIFNALHIEPNEVAEVSTRRKR